MTRYLPIATGVLVIVGLTIWQAKLTDRLAGSNVKAEQCAKLLELVPKDIGDWHGEDKPIDERVRQVAGAIGAISRGYHNTRTGEQVDLWLIVGHSRDVSFHTPDVCFPGAGFEAYGKESGNYSIVVEGLSDTPTFTNRFFKSDITGQQLVRVFWTWYNPAAHEDKSQVIWEAPGNPRTHFGNARALYKMYFTSRMRDGSETAEESAGIHFAKDALPVIGKALKTFQSNLGSATATTAAKDEPPPPAPTPAPEAATETK